MREIPTMPEEFKGRITKSGGYTTTAPRKWTPAEIEWVKDLNEKGYTNKEIAVSIGRSEISTQIKIKRLGKTDKTYNQDHIEEKHRVNAEFINHIEPLIVMDVYAGERSFYENRCCFIASNDINKAAKTSYHMDALKFLCLMYKTNCEAEIVDLDPFGSAYDCFDLAIKMARKGIAITFGELGHKRWKRLDFVGSHYGITRLEDFTLDRLIEHVQMIGRRNKKNLKVYAKREGRNGGRVWFEIEPIKITEQWKRKEVKKND